MTSRKTRTTRRKFGLLIFIFAGLILSSLLRLGSDFALAKEDVGKGEKPIVKDVGELSGAVCVAGNATGPLLEAIRARQAVLKAREEKFEDRMQALKVAELRLKDSTAALVKAEIKLAATLAIADEAAEKDLKRLTMVYENMKTKNAASLFGEMAPEFAAGFLARMRADAAAGIMSNLDPSKAYTISLVLAGRNAAAPKR